MQENSLQLSPELLSGMKLHGFLLWASLGFLMPVGVLAIRVSRCEKFERRLGLILRVHAALQIASAVVVTVAAAMSIKNFGNSFNNWHQRIGIVLYGAIWLQVLIGFLRPQRGCKERKLWCSLHWALGTALTLLGVINIYTGLLAYHDMTSRSVKLWMILFTAEVTSVSVIYLFQDKWPYIRQQQQVNSLREEPIMPEMRLPFSKPKEEMMA
ncbi:hypothetical protein MLD38_030598 [Melastoma candidum]|uniref:Uncharacterized protein n=1 Tax=Melastoma candidum TaxID=119954 RepID=A0ACB9MP82_9MYRT|nr:hypothetical protein MLD38_030598 [Melastoma candidum]